MKSKSNEIFLVGFLIISLIIVIKVSMNIEKKSEYSSYKYQSAENDKSYTSTNVSKSISNNSSKSDTTKKDNQSNETKSQKTIELSEVKNTQEEIIPKMSDKEIEDWIKKKLRTNITTEDVEYISKRTGKKKFTKVWRTRILNQNHL